MDYIQEELLRQKQALERLMVGGAKAAKTENAAEEAAAGLTAGSGEAAKRSAAKTAAAEETFREERRRTAAAEARGGARRNGGLPMAGGAVGVVAVERLSAAVQTEKTDARAVSRVIQRDARRYDGGFSLY